MGLQLMFEYLCDDFRCSRASGDWGLVVGDLIQLAIVFGIPSAFLIAFWVL